MARDDFATPAVPSPSGSSAVCRWAACDAALADEGEAFVDLPLSEQVTRGKELLSLLQGAKDEREPAAPPSPRGARGAMLTSMPATDFRQGSGSCCDGPSGSYGGALASFSGSSGSSYSGASPPGWRAQTDNFASGMVAPPGSWALAPRPPDHHPSPFTRRDMALSSGDMTGMHPLPWQNGVSSGFDGSSSGGEIMNGYCVSQAGMECSPPPHMVPSPLGWPGQTEGLASGMAALPGWTRVQEGPPMGTMPGSLVPCGAWTEAAPSSWPAQREWQHGAPPQLNPHAMEYVPSHWGAMPRFPYAGPMSLPVEARA